MARVARAFDGCYAARRAAALSGVPVSTVYHWARIGVVEPSVSRVREKLWSYADLMALRIVYWLRHPKEAGTESFAASPMPEVRRALARLEEEGADIWEGPRMSGSPLLVSSTGKIHIQADDYLIDSLGQSRFNTFLDLLGPFDAASLRGPDLRQPKPHLRIVPGKCSGEPHLAGTRITTPTIAALVKRKYEETEIARLYPHEDPNALREAIVLERELADNLRAVA